MMRFVRKLTQSVLILAMFVKQCVLLLFSPSPFRIVIRSCQLAKALNESFIFVKSGLFRTSVRVVSQKHSFYSMRKALLRQKPLEEHCFNEDCRPAESVLKIDNLRQRVTYAGQHIHKVGQKYFVMSKTPFVLTDLFLKRFYHEEIDENDF